MQSQITEREPHSDFMPLFSLLCSYVSYEDFFTTAARNVKIFQVTGNQENFRSTWTSMIDLQATSDKIGIRYIIAFKTLAHARFSLTDDRTHDDLLVLQYFSIRHNLISAHNSFRTVEEHRKVMF